jgi:hypothetical protein
MKKHELIIGKNKGSLIGYSDADWALQEHRHSISAYAFLIDGGAISWSCQKQHIIALLITEAEFISLTQAAKDALWLSNCQGTASLPLISAHCCWGCKFQPIQDTCLCGLL